MAHELYDPRFDAILPVAVVSTESADDVSAAITFAARHGLPLAMRAGGHSYLGASTGRGLVIDMRRMSQIDVAPDASSVTCGSGVRLIDAYATLAAHGVSIPAGSCPTVGLTGLALGGGVGVVSRLHGLTCDRVQSLRVVTATGDQVTADAATNPDLYFALRGGGGSFAAVTSLTLETHPTSTLAVFALSWPWSAAGAVLSAWQAWTGQVSDELWSTCHLLSTDDPSTGPTVAVSGVWVGDSAGASSYLDDLVRLAGSQPSSRYLADRAYLDTMLLEAGCDHESVETCHLVGTSTTATVQRTTFVAASDLYSQPIPSDGTAAIVAAVLNRQQTPGLGVGGVAFDALGGAIARVAPDATAFVHRRAMFGAQWSASWPVSDPGAQQRNERSLAALQASGHRYADGAYCNYPTAGRPDAARAYWGKNLPRLRAIKGKWDPHNLFNQPEGIAPPGT